MVLNKFNGKLEVVNLSPTRYPCVFSKVIVATLDVMLAWRTVCVLTEEREAVPFNDPQ